MAKVATRLEIDTRKSKQDSQMSMLLESLLITMTMPDSSMVTEALRDSKMLLLSLSFPKVFHLSTMEVNKSTQVEMILTTEKFYGQT